MLLAKESPEEVVFEEDGSSLATALIVDDETEGSTSANLRPVKKAKVSAKRGIRTLDSFMDRAMTKDEKEKTDLILLRYSQHSILKQMSIDLNGKLDSLYMEILPSMHLATCFFTNGFTSCGRAMRSQAALS